MKYSFNAITKTSTIFALSIMASVLHAQAGEAGAQPPGLVTNLDIAAQYHRIVQHEQVMMPARAPREGNKIRLRRYEIPIIYDGPLTIKTVGSVSVGRTNALLANVDSMDRGFNKTALTYLSRFNGVPAKATCYVHLEDDASVCEVIAHDVTSGRDINIGAEILKKGWVGWQTEAGAYRDNTAHTYALTAYWSRAGVWANPWYFPAGIFRNAT